jgi:hypothetical protein
MGPAVPCHGGDRLGHGPDLLVGDIREPGTLGLLPVPVSNGAPLVR